MPAVMDQADGRAPARARRRPPTRWSPVPPAVPLDPQPVVSGWNLRDPLILLYEINNTKPLLEQPFAL